MHKKFFTKIGIFDSGLGGLTVLKPLLSEYPAQYVYFADTANLPYGSKTVDEIKCLSQKIAFYLEQQSVDCCVIACHTISAVALHHLRNHFPIPFFGVIDLVAKKAAQATKNKRVGVMATVASIASHAHKDALLSLDPTITVIEQACPRIVPAIESLSNPALLHSILSEDLAIMRHQAIDTLILGSTHYPLGAGLIQEILGAQVTLIAADAQIAHTFLPAAMKESSVSLYVSGDPDEFKQKAKHILHWDLPMVNQIEI